MIKPREWQTKCCERHTPGDERLLAVAQAIDKAANTPRVVRWISHEHDLKLIAEAAIAALDASRSAAQ